MQTFFTVRSLNVIEKSITENKIYNMFEVYDKIRNSKNIAFEVKNESNITFFILYTRVKKIDCCN